MFRLQPQFHSFGLDISDLTVRGLDLHQRRGRTRIQTFGELIVPPGIIVEGEIRNPRGAVKIIEQLVHSLHGLSTRNVVASLPERKTFTKVVEIPSLPDNEVDEAVKWEVEQHIPIDITDAYVDWQPIPSLQAGLKRSFLVAVAPKSIVDSYTATLDAAKLRPVALETESAAIARCIVPSGAGTTDIGTIIVDIGASRTGLIVFDRGVIEFTSTVNISGRQMTDLIAKRLKLDWDKAEQIKNIYGLEDKRGRGSIRELLEPTIAALGQKIQEAIVYYQDHVAKGTTIQRVILCGGVSQMKRLPEVLALSLPFPIALANPWANTFIPQNLSKGFRNLSFTTAIGLALRESS